MTSAYHSGELEVQARAGTQDMACRVSKSIHASIPPAAREFLRNQAMAILSTVDPNGRVWASLLTGQPGFLHATGERTVQIDATPVPGDPLSESLRVGDRVGLLAIEFATRRRMRINGMVAAYRDGHLSVQTDQVYANCPKYIQARVASGQGGHEGAVQAVRRAVRFTDEHQRWIEQADTFFIASFHEASGADVSHRGGNPGFIHVENGNTLVWPDYSGNQMFQSLGNISVNPNAGLLFIDFESGSTLQLTGQAHVIWDNDQVRAFAGAERLVEFHIEQVIEIIGASPLRWRLVEYSPFNPA
jgi:predicted pyridoxine 5'-phosphate oxidase superfamily flavin-nucleotide-binding protein